LPRLRRRTIGAACVGALVVAGGLAPGAQAKPHSGSGITPQVGAFQALSGPKLLSAGVTTPASAGAGSAFVAKGRVINDGTGAIGGTVRVKLTRQGVKPRTVGTASFAAVGPHKTGTYKVKVKIPKKGLKKGTYLLTACVPQNGASGPATCATSVNRVTVGKAAAAAGPKADAARNTALRSASSSSRREECTSGARTLSQPGDVIYPDAGNGGYKSVHSDVNLRYDADANLFKPGTYVDLTQLSTQCLSDFSLDFEPTNTVTGGPNLTISAITIDGVPATWAMKQPTYPGDPNGPDDPDPNAHTKGNANPVNATVNKPPACSPNSTQSSQIGAQCPATKLVITPSAPIPSGTTFKVKVEYSGKPGLHSDADGSTEGWFRDSSANGPGSFVTTEPIGGMAWMPLNNHPLAKPTYDQYSTTQTNRTVGANGEYAGATLNDPDADFPAGSKTWHWHMASPMANYLVTNNIGSYDMTQIASSNPAVYNQLQNSAISSAQKTTNTNVLVQQPTITDFQKTLNGPYPFTTGGVIIALPSVSFEEEMQTMITFQGSSIGLSTLVHENMHQWWGDNVSEAAFRYTALKEGFASLGEYYWSARTAANTASTNWLNGHPGDTAGAKVAYDAAWESSLNTQFNSTQGWRATSWGTAPFNPTAASLFTSANAYRRPSTAYLAMRSILGQTRMNAAMTYMQTTYGGGNIDQDQQVAAWQKYLPNQSQACKDRVVTWENQWMRGTVKPTIAGASGLTGTTSANDFFTPTVPGCSAPSGPTTSSSLKSGNGKLWSTGTVALTAADTTGKGVASTTYTLDGGSPLTYTAPVPVSGAGDHTIVFHSVDADGNTEPDVSRTFQIDTTAPISVASVSPDPAGEGVVETPATVTLTATDEQSGIASKEYKVDGASSWTTYTAPITLTTGLHTVTYRSTDGAGNVETPQTLNLDVRDPAANAAPSNVTSETATLNGTLGPVTTSYQFLYRKYGDTTWTETAKKPAGSDLLASADLSSLTPSTLYYYKIRAILSNGAPYYYTAQASFATPADPFGPSDIVVNAPTDVTTTGATLSSSVDTHGVATTAIVEWGTSAGTYTKSAALYRTGTGDVKVFDRSLPTSFAPNTLYHYRITTTSALGTRSSTDQTFSTLAPGGPFVTIGAVSPIGPNTATVNTVVDADGDTITATSVEWGKTTAYGKSLPMLPGATGPTGRIYTRPLQSLSANTTYHYKVTVSTASHTYTSGDLTFTTTS